MSGVSRKDQWLNARFHLSVVETKGGKEGV